MKVYDRENTYEGIASEAFISKLFSTLWEWINFFLGIIKQTDGRATGQFSYRKSRANSPDRCYLLLKGSQ